MEMTVKNCKGIEGNQKFEKGKKKTGETVLFISIFYSGKNYSSTSKLRVKKKYNILTKTLIFHDNYMKPCDICHSYCEAKKLASYQKTSYVPLNGILQPKQRWIDMSKTSPSNKQKPQNLCKHLTFSHKYLARQTLGNSYKPSSMLN